MSRPLRINSLTEKEREALESLTRQAIGRIAERAWMVLFSADGRTAPEIAAIFHCSLNKVRRWIKRYQREGIDGLYDQPRSGRPSSRRALNESTERAYKKITDQSIGASRFRSGQLPKCCEM